MVLLTVLSAAVVGATLRDVTPESRSAPRVSITASADAARDRIALTHRSGDSLTVSDLRIEIHVDGERLANQPPVPFFAATGFESGPTGPFNTAADGTWQAGETGAVRIADTNSPQLATDATVTVHVYTEHHRIATVTARA